MSLFEDIFKGGAGSGLAVGVGAAILAPVVLPVVGRIVKPVAMAALRTGISLYRETSTEVSRVATDLYREAEADLATAGATGEGAKGSRAAHRGER